MILYYTSVAPWNKDHIFSSDFLSKLGKVISFLGHHEWIEYLFSKDLIETIHSEHLGSLGWLLSFLWASLNQMSPAWWEPRALIIRVLSSGSCPLWGHFLLKTSLDSVYPLSLFSLSFSFSLLQAKVKLILFHNFLSERFLPQRHHLRLSAWKMWLRWRQSEYLCLTKWLMFFFLIHIDIESVQ